MMNPRVDAVSLIRGGTYYGGSPSWPPSYRRPYNGTQPLSWTQVMAPSRPEPEPSNGVSKEGGPDPSSLVPEEGLL